MDDFSKSREEERALRFSRSGVDRGDGRAAALHFLDPPDTAITRPQTLFGVAAAFLRKDFIHEMRTGRALLGGSAFSVAVVVLVALSRPAGMAEFSDTISTAWLALLFASQIAVSRSVHDEKEGGRWEAILSTGVDPVNLFLGKAVSIFAFLTLLSIPITVSALFFLPGSADQLPAFLLVAAIGSAALAISAPMLVLIAHASPMRDILLPFLHLIFFAPLAVISILATQQILFDGAAGPAFWALTAFFAMTTGGVVLLAPFLAEND